MRHNIGILQAKSSDYSHEELREAFSHVKDSSDWKAPISVKSVNEDDVALTVVAIEYFTATACDVILNIDTLKYRIESIGYRAGPAGDY